MEQEHKILHISALLQQILAKAIIKRELDDQNDIAFDRIMYFIIAQHHYECTLEDEDLFQTAVEKELQKLNMSWEYFKKVISARADNFIKVDNQQYEEQDLFAMMIHLITCHYFKKRKTSRYLVAAQKIRDEIIDEDINIYALIYNCALEMLDHYFPYLSTSITWVDSFIEDIEGKKGTVKW